ncbi:MAG TPA: T9SS type A sorting domain-containing protein [bacterium (Candidatus Stahlbacteria)]|nr:T9SS type A sorting domain-containing protein [Candidatus Stahlbacteria bacterium]
MKFHQMAIVLLALVSSLWAKEYLVVEGREVVNLGGLTKLDDAAGQSPMIVKPAPIWEGLEQMTESERMNSSIEIELGTNSSKEAEAVARRIEQLWNSGRYEDALSLFPELAEIVDGGEIAIGNTWRTPVPTREGSDWGNDVRVGNQDSIYVNDLDIHRASGNLFAILLYPQGSAYYWSVNFSTDGGATWNETFTFGASYQINWVDASVLANHCYVAYIVGTNQDGGRLRRFRVSDGQPEDFNNGQAFITVFTLASGAIEEVNLTSNQDFFNNRLYYMSLTSTDELKYFWDDTGAVSWSEVNTGVTDADRGLDACTNEDYGTYFLLASYLTTSDQIKIDGRSSSWDNLITRTAGSGTDYTAIGAYHDTLLCAYDYHRGASLWVRYLTSYNGGSTWYWGTFDDTTTLQKSPDVALRAGGGEGVIYRFYTSPRELRYTWRNYAGGWSTPVNLADVQPYYNKPAIEHLGSGAFGVLFLSWTTPYQQAAYFDRSDWVTVEEEQTGLASRLITLAPNPSKGTATLSFTIDSPGNVKALLYDATGRLVDNLLDERRSAGTHTIKINRPSLPSGIYFVRVETANWEAAERLILLK